MIRFLQSPGKTKKLILAGILLFFCAVLVATLVPTGGGDFSGNRTGVLAKVGGDEVTITELQALIQRYTGSTALNGPMVDQAFQFVVQQKAMLMEADRLGLRVTDGELRDVLRKQFANDLFPKGEYVGDEKYTQFVQTQRNMPSIQEFEKDLKTRLLLSKLENTVTAGAQVAPEEVQHEFQKQNTKVKVQYAVIKGDEISKKINPTETELKAYYELHKASYSNPIPEQRKARYIVIDIGKLQNQVKVSSDDAQRYYNQHKDEFRQAEEVKARHILIKVPPKVDAKTDDAARAKAEDILKQLKAGANFEELAKKNSEDEGSAPAGGSLGWFQRGRMVAEFEKAAFSTPPGQISGIVKTDFGYHIIKVEDKHEARLKPLEEVKPEIEKILGPLKAQQQADSVAATVTADARSQGLDAAAAKNHLDVTNSDWFAHTASLPGIGSSPDFMDAVFSAKEKSPPSEVGTSTSYVVFQLTGVKPPVPPTYDDVRTQVVNDYKTEQTSMLVNKKAQELSDRAHALNDLQRAAKELGVTVQTSDKLLGPTDQVPNLGSMRGGAAVAFSMKTGEISSVIRAGGNAAVLTVLERQEPTAADLEKSGDQIRERLLQQKRSEMLQLYAEGLKQTLEKEGKIKVNQQELDTYTKRAPETNYNQ